MKLALLGLATLGVLTSPGCDSESERKRVEAEVLHSFEAPASIFQRIDEFESGNGGGGPIVVLEYSGDRHPRLHDIVPPREFEKVEYEPQAYELFIPAVGADVRWRTLGDFVGPTPDGSGECHVWLLKGDIAGRSLVMLGAACSLDTPSPAGSSF